MDSAKTFIAKDENEGIALVKFFLDCGIQATRKGNIVKAKGDADTLSYLYGKFVSIAIL